MAHSEGTWHITDFARSIVKGQAWLSEERERNEHPSSGAIAIKAPIFFFSATFLQPVWGPAVSCLSLALEDSAASLIES